MVSNNEALTVLWQPPQDIHQSGLYDNTTHKIGPSSLWATGCKENRQKKDPSDWNYCSMRMKI